MTKMRLITMEKNDHSIETLGLAADIVAAYVAHHSVDPQQLPSLIQNVYTGLLTVFQKNTLLANRPEPAVSLEDSVTSGYIVCLEDGRKLKMLKRHLKTAYNMTPAQYRERWGLPADYPMVAPDYAKHRSRLARDNGLGRQRGPRKVRLHNVG